MVISIWNQWRRCPRWWHVFRVSRKPRRIAAGLCVALVLLGVGVTGLRMYAASAPHTSAQVPPTLLAVGDIADCHVDETHHMQTAALVDMLPGTIALLGDIAYTTGSPEEFADCYQPSWGRHDARVRPAPGNHEYGTVGAAGYFGYFGATATPLEPDCRVKCQGYYSYEVGDWHIIALNSEQAMTAGSTQEQWLRADLLAHRNTACTLAYWHHPRFSSGAHGDDPRSADVWVALYEAGVDVVLNGHDHDYERFAPLNPDGEVDRARGIRQFVVGTGGVKMRNFDHPHPHSEVKNNDVWGVLQLSLFADHYAWEFKPIAGEQFAESGTSPCVPAADDWKAESYIPWLIGSSPNGQR